MTANHTDEHRHSAHLDFVAIPELLREPDGNLEAIDLQFIMEHVPSRGIKNRDYSTQSYYQVRGLAKRMQIGEDVLQSLQKNYNFIYWMTRKVRTGATNSIGGMCYDIALMNYSDVVERIKEIKEENERRE